MLRQKILKENDVINNQYVLLEKIDRIQHSSQIYKGWDRLQKTFVVIKITSHTHKEKNKHVTKILKLLNGGAGIPNIIWRGVVENQTITVTDCLGPNLKKLFCLMDRRFSVPTICMIAIRLLSTLEYIHNHGIACCNIMPKEILISLNKKNQNLFITDFKQARKVENNKMKTSERVHHSTNRLILNKFSSVNVHLGLPPSKKDDLESLGYILVYFFKGGEVFEKNVKYASKEEKFKHYESQKLQMIPEVFCYGLPGGITEYFTYLKTFQFTNAVDKPNYEYMRKLFKKIFYDTCLIPEAFEYDWIQLAIYGFESSNVKKYEKNSTIEMQSANDSSWGQEFEDIMESEPSIGNPLSLNRSEGSPLNYIFSPRSFERGMSNGSVLQYSSFIRSRTLGFRRNETYRAQTMIEEDSGESEFNQDDFDENKCFPFEKETTNSELVSEESLSRRFFTKTMTSVKTNFPQTEGAVLKSPVMIEYQSRKDFKNFLVPFWKK